VIAITADIFNISMAVLFVASVLESGGRFFIISAALNCSVQKSNMQ
jgi:hypothetical protein